MDKFKVGDKVKIEYVNDGNKYNNEVGTITWLHEYNYYPNRDYSVIEKRTQATIIYPDGGKIDIANIYRETSGLFTKVEKVSY